MDGQIPMYFQNLQQRLIATVNQRVKNGELTERKLAMMIGISQPHMHNVLKGVRDLSSRMSDRLLKGLRITVLELVDRGPDGWSQRCPAWAETEAGAGGPLDCPYARELAQRFSAGDAPLPRRSRVPGARSWPN